MESLAHRAYLTHTFKLTTRKFELKERCNGKVVNSCEQLYSTNDNAQRGESLNSGRTNTNIGYRIAMPSMRKIEREEREVGRRSESKFKAKQSKLDSDQRRRKGTVAKSGSQIGRRKTED